MLTWQSEPWAWVAGAAFVAVIAALALVGAARSGWKRGITLLEGLRIVIAAALAVTLLQPEWRVVLPPSSKPVLLLLHDNSGSMETEDVASPAGDGTLISRLAAAEPLLDEALWEPVTERFDVARQAFSSLEDPPREATDLDAALSAALESHPALAAVVLISDGDRNTGQPPAAAATRLRMRGVPVLAVPVGSESRLPDLEVTGFDVPAFAVAGKPLRIPFSLESSLQRDEVVRVRMEVEDSAETVEKEVLVPAMGRAQDSLSWMPGQPGTVRLSLNAPPVPGERDTANNRLEASLDVRKEQLRVLVIESHPRWEYRYLRNALERDPGVTVNTLLFHPDLEAVGAGRGYLAALPSEEELAGYDVIFLGDAGVAPDQLTADQCVMLHRLVRDQATGLVLLPGLRGGQASLQQTPIEELNPVVWDAAQPRGYGSQTPGRLTLTEAGARSLLTRLEDSDEASAALWPALPGFHWYAPALRAKAGSEVLAIHSTESNRFGRVPLIVTKTFGAGKILFMGTDGAWRWRRGVEDRYHYRFWGQVVRWMAYQRNMARGERLRLFYAPDRPRTGGSLTLNANVMSATGEPLTDGVVMAQIAAPSGRSASIRLTPAGEEAWGLFTGSFTPREPGEHLVRLSSADAGEALETRIDVQGSALEKRGQPARPEVLAEIAQLTRGRLLSDAAPERVVEAIATLPEPEPEERRLLLWCHPAWVGGLILLMGVFWAGRKSAGVF